MGARSMGRQIEKQARGGLRAERPSMRGKKSPYVVTLVWADNKASQSKFLKAGHWKWR